MTLLDVQRRARRPRRRGGGRHVRAPRRVRSRRVAPRCLGGFDRLDLLHLNAGIYDTALDDITHDLRSTATARTSASTSTACSSACASDPAARADERRGSGHVVDGGHRSRCRRTRCTRLTKFALIGLVRSIHGELERRGIRINALCPGAVATPAHGRGPARVVRRARHRRRSSPRSGRRPWSRCMDSDRSGEVVLHRPPWDPEVFEFVEAAGGD